MLLIYGGHGPAWRGKVKRLVEQNIVCSDFRNKLLVYWHAVAGNSAVAVTRDEIMGM